MNHQKNKLSLFELYQGKHSINILNRYDDNKSNIPNEYFYTFKFLNISAYNETTNCYKMVYKKNFEKENR